MELKNDYIHFNLENAELIDALKSNQTLTYDYLQPVFAVLDFINESDFEIEGENKQDVIDVFQIGYEYLYDTFETIKNILEENFQDEIESLIKMDQNLYLYLRVDEIDSILEGKNQVLAGLIDTLSTTFEYKTDLNKKAVEMIETEIDKATKTMEEVTTPDQFMDFADSLGIDLI